jgi:hypothetical protein
MKSRAIILLVSAVISGFFLRTVPVPEPLEIFVIEGLFPLVFACLAIFLWEPSSLRLRTMLVLGACSLGYTVDLILRVFRGGFDDVAAFKAGLFLLAFRMLLGVCALTAGCLTLKWIRRLKNP